MIDVLDGFPDDVAAYACHGRLTKADYRVVLDDIEGRLARHDRLRMYCEVGADYAGSGADSEWQDWRSSFSSWFHWDRGAIVTDVEWMSWATRFFGFLIPGEWRVYPRTEVGAARKWITE